MLRNFSNYYIGQFNLDTKKINLLTDFCKISFNMSAPKAKSTLTSVTQLKSSEAKFVKPISIEYLLDGEKLLKWEGILTHDSVAIILYNKTRNKLIFVKQFRPALMTSSIYDHELKKRQHPLKSDGYTIELCAGIIDKDKSLKEIAKEEILEEVGYDVNLESIQPVTNYRVNSGINGSMQHLFFAEIEDKQKVNEGGGVHLESIEIIELTPEECKKNILFCDDENAIASRSASLLFSLNWFLNEYLPKN